MAKMHIHPTFRNIEISIGVIETSINFKFRECFNFHDSEETGNFLQEGQKYRESATRYGYNW